MTRKKFALALALSLAAMPIAVRAQEPKDNKWTKDATKFLGLAQLRQTPEEKAPLFQQALTALKEGQQKEPENAKIWLLSGQVLAGLDSIDSADQAFQKAEKLNPAYSNDIDEQREQLWLKLFQSGVAAMDSQKNDDAIAALEHAERIYAKRPEALLNLGMLYSSRIGTDPNAKDKATKALQNVVLVTHGPMAEKLPAETKAQWKSFEDMANLSIAQIEATQGFEAFQAQKFTEAADAFRRAMKINPYSRDYSYNLAQALYAYVGKLDQQRKALCPAPATPPAKGAPACPAAKQEEAKKLAEQLTPVYAELLTIGQKVQAMDPNNSDVYRIQARAYRGLGDIAPDAKAKTDFQNKSLEVLTANQNLPVEVNDVQVQFLEGEAKVTGSVAPLKAKESEPVKVRITFVDATGQPVGNQEVTVAAPAANASVPLTASIKLTGAAAGWKYEVVK